MCEPLRIFFLLLYKSLLVRKHHWVATLLCEILIPILLVWFSQSIGTSLSSKDQHVSGDSHFKAQSAHELIESMAYMYIYYAPNNRFTIGLMSHVKQCLHYKVDIFGFPTEKHFEAYYRKHKDFGGIAVIFDESVVQSIRDLSYKIRIIGMSGPLYNDRVLPRNMTELYTVELPLAQTQICLDRSFVNVKSGGKPVPDMYIQRVPYPEYTKAQPIAKPLREMVNNMLLDILLLPLLIESNRASQEKITGVNVLMAMNGISNTMNLLSWLVSGILFVSIFVAEPIVWLLTRSSLETLSFLHYGDPIVFFIILALFLGHLLAFGLHLSAYFTKSWLAMIVITIVYVVMVNVRRHAFTDSTLYLVPYVGIIFPNVLLHDQLIEIEIYESRAEGVHWYNLFMSADSLSKVGGNVGMFLIFSVIGMTVHLILAIFVYTVLPGKYGVARNPFKLLIAKFERKKNIEDDIESLKYEEMDDKRFESVSAGSYVPGIQIRNLNKTFNISLFSKEKVHALRDVSVDFYKGQITALLGHNGAGKTTMMSILTSMLSPTSGVVLINSKDLKTNSSEIMKDMGLCPQENMCFTSLSVSEQLLFFARVKGKGKSISQINQYVNDLMQKIEMFQKRNIVPSELSGGQKRRLCLCMALVGDSSILILDEPTSGLDPESRRLIWNVLLKMRGQKTILISTHDMEEANVLGDKIAIMHNGELKSYGTSLFLKKIIGQNRVEITCSIGSQAYPDRIRTELHSGGIITKRETGRIVVSIPNTSSLPETLDNLERKKKELGVTGFSVALISLEQVFLKVTQDNEEPTEPPEEFDNEGPKLRGIRFCLQSVHGLLSKNLTYAVKNYSLIIGKIIVIFIGLLINGLMWKGFQSLGQYGEDPVPINLKMYHTPDVIYTGYDKSLANRYKTVVQNLGGNAIEVTDTHLDNALLRRAKENLALYDNYLIAAAEFNKTSVNAFYSEMTTYSLPISINLLGNTILQNILGSSYSIRVINHYLPLMLSWRVNMSSGIAYGTTFFFYILFCSAVAIFVIHPSHEKTTDVKQLQKMTGASGLSYWGTMFFIDLIEYTVLVLLVVMGFVCADLILERRMFGMIEIITEIESLLLFGASILPFIYIFSFLPMKTNTVLMCLMSIPTMIMIIELILMNSLKNMKQIREIQKTIFLTLPYGSFLHSQLSFFTTAETNARCRRLPNEFYQSWCKDPNFQDICCGFKCQNGKCENLKEFFVDDYEEISLKTSAMYLCLTPILYFLILALMESRIFSRCTSISFSRVEPPVDEQVEREKTMVYERIQMLRGKNPSSVTDTSTSQVDPPNMDDLIFLVYELRKSYGWVRAVKDISFGVNRRECFGLLGVNGAGKSTTFRMMTGGEIRDHGIMYLGGKDFRMHSKSFLAQMGYCPQQDAMLENLNSYDHLKLFARLRGIPEKRVKQEVQAWIDRLNLVACASRPCGTYSGGNKRRLNIAMALIGNPNLILMDEPTTGVDPAARRSLWNVIKDCQNAGQAVVLTSHSMEECEALCNRLAIMVDGKLVCIGASEHLKQRFGAGYDIQIKMNIEKAKDQVDDIKNDMPTVLNCELSDENLGYLMYHVSPTGTTWRKMYDVMYGMKKKYDCIEDFLVLSASLEQLFLMFARTSGNPSPQPNN